MCGSDNRVARHVQKMIETRFAKYSMKLAKLDASELITCVMEDPASVQIPLWAILWDLATRGLKNGKSVETALFGFIHMLEHQLLKDHWKSFSSEGERNHRETDKDREILSLKRDLLDMQWANGRLEKVVEDLRSRIDSAGLYRLGRDTRPLLATQTWIVVDAQTAGRYAI
jgi:hypothetical protein